LRNQRIDRGIPLFVVDAVQNADETVRPLLEHTFEPESLLPCHDLDSVTRADGGYLVGEDETSLQKAKILVKLKVGGAEEILVKIQIMPVRPPKISLERYIVDGDNCFCRGNLRVAQSLCLEKYRC
jgi:hypothetical protein